MNKISGEYKKSLKFLIQWMIISITAGITGSVLVAFFYYMVTESSSFIHSTSIPFPLWTIAGALFCGLVFYRISPTASGDGIPSYINGVLEKKGHYSFKESISKLLATLTALTTLSGGGMLGPAGRVSAGINSRINKVLTEWGLVSDNRRTASICGMSAVV